jgi:thioredoxin-related protein
MQKVTASILVILLFMSASSFAPHKEQVNWLTIEQLNEAYAKEPKPIIIDLYTDWCGWCKVMDNNTYGNAKVAAYINKNYYAVKYNAESTDSLKFNNKVFKFNRQYRSNELAMYLTFGRLEYPTTVFLSSLEARPAPLSGYMKPKEIEAPLKFFGERANEKQTFVAFQKTMKREWK